MIRKFLRKRLTRKVGIRSFCRNEKELQIVIEEKFNEMIQDYNKKPEKLEDYKKQLRWRARNLGMKEMDILVSAWAEKFLVDCNAEETLRFEREILNMETPDLFKLVFMPGEELDKFELSEQHYLFAIREYAASDWNRT